MLPLGSKRDKCFRGLHDMIEENVWIRPRDGARYCKECQKTTRYMRNTSLDEETKKPLCRNKIHIMADENTRGRYKSRQCVQCLEDEDILHDSELGAPLLNSSGDRLRWSDLQIVDFS